MALGAIALEMMTLRVRVVTWVREQGAFQLFHSIDSDFLTHKAKIRMH